MATSWTYTTLKAALQDFVEDDSTEYASAIDNIILLAEDRVLRDLDLDIFDTTATTSFSAATATLTKPTGFISERALHYTDANGDFQYLEKKSWEYVKDYWPKESTTTASPKYFADYDATTWYLVGTPSGTNAVTVRYVKRPAAMTSGNPTTWIGTNAGDVFFYACLTLSAEYLNNDPRIPTWEREYQTRLTAAKDELKPLKRAEYMPVRSIPTKEA